jgi:hypothetical protein
MKNVIKVLLVLTPFLFCGCSIMNDKFSCNLTASDNCLTIDEVNAMTEGKSVIKIKKRTKSQVWKGQRLVDNKKSAGDKLWIAPRKDEKGVMHGSSLVFIPSTSAKA